MKKTALRYGLFSATVLIVLFIIGFLAFGSADAYEAQEILGYSSMVISMLFVFFGIKHFRDHVNGGHLSFGKGMKMGLLIIIIPSLAFGLFDLLYAYVINPGALDKYYDYQLSKMQASMTASEFNAERAKMESAKAMFSNPAVNFLVMTLTVFIIGVIASVISSLILRRNK